MFNGEIVTRPLEHKSFIMDHCKHLGGGAYLSQFPDGIPVVVKQKKTDINCLWKDELKEAFLLPKVGISYFKLDDLYLLKYHHNHGTLKGVHANAVRPAAFGVFFMRLCAYDYVIQNGDRHSNNLLILDETHLLPIDEATKKRPPDLWCPRFNSAIVDRIRDSYREIKNNFALRSYLWNYIPPGVDEYMRELNKRLDIPYNDLIINYHRVLSGTDWLHFTLDKFGMSHLVRRDNGT
jgi:hypothetical protein